LRPHEDLKATDTRPFDPSTVLRASSFRSGHDLRRHKLHYLRLYQISHFPVKENLSKQSRKYFWHLPWACLQNALLKCCSVENVDCHSEAKPKNLIS